MLLQCNSGMPQEIVDDFVLRCRSTEAAYQVGSAEYPAFFCETFRPSQASSFSSCFYIEKLA